MDDDNEMANIGCPFCTKLGVGMVISGLVLVVISAMTPLPWLAIIGLIILFAAYIVPNLVSGRSCHTQPSTSSAHKPGEDESQ